MRELEAILVKVQADLAGGAGGPLDPKGTSGSSNNFGEEGELVSSLPSFSGVFSCG